MAGKNRVGLDIGSRFIKAVQLTEDNGKLTISEFGIAELDQPENATQVISDLFSRKSFRCNKRVNLGVSGRSVFVRYVPMGVMNDVELVNAARYELNKYIPIEVDEVIHDCKRLADPAEGEAEMKVVLVAARKAFIEKQVHLVDNADLYPDLIDVECFALSNAYEALLNIKAASPEGMPAGGVTALVEIGATKSNVVIVNNRTCQFTREFYKGGDDITDMISKKMSIDAKAAEKLKRASQDDPSKIQAAIEDALEDICQDVRISIDFYESQHDAVVEQVLLTGGSATVPGLQEAMSKTVGKPMDLWNPTTQFPDTLSPDSKKELTAAGWQAGVALGLAVRES